MRRTALALLPLLGIAACCIVHLASARSALGCVSSATAITAIAASFAAGASVATAVAAWTRRAASRAPVERATLEAAHSCERLTGSFAPPSKSATRHR